MDEGILSRQRSAMERYDLDALVATSKENVNYGAGYPVPSQILGIHNRQFSVVATRDGRSALLLSSNEAAEARVRTPILDLRPYDEFADDPMAVLADLLVELGVGEGRIGLEMDALGASWWERLKPKLPNARWENGADAFAHARMVKTPTELALLRSAARVADLAQAFAHKEVRAGMTERDLHRLLVNGVFANGGEAILMIQVAAGERSAFSNPTPSERVLKPGEPIKIDMFVTVNGYMSDTGRSIFLERVSPEHRELWLHMEETLVAIYDVVRPGASTADLWRAFVATFQKNAMKPAIRFLGHGLGLSLHEDPFLAAHTDTELEEGMVFAVEPVYKIDDLGFHLEDNLIVTSDGIENMTTLLGSGPIVVG